MRELQSKIVRRQQLAAHCETLRAAGRRVVFTNGCFDILHAGHVQLLQTARGLGDFLIVGLNSDGSVRRLKGGSRPVNPQDARAAVLAALSAVDAVCIFDEDTPIESIESFRPAIHVKGGDYRADDLPEAAAVRRAGGEIRTVPLVEGFSTTGTLAALNDSEPAKKFDCTIVIPARYGSTRFPGKPLAKLGDKTVIEHVVARALATGAELPIIVATDDARIAGVIKNGFNEQQANVVMTSRDCATGTDRLAQVARTLFEDDGKDLRRVVINVQGDEPFIDPRHIDALIEAMRADPVIKMATLATPITEAAQIEDSNVVKVVLAENGDALYFSRCSIPFVRDAPASNVKKLRHLGVYAYTVEWLLEFAALPPSPLEETEKLEQLRALENGCRIRVVTVQNVINIAIDTPADLEAAQKFLHENP